MTNFYKTQTKGFAVFLILSVLTALNFVIETDSAYLSGVLAIIWGVFGFFRIIDLTYNKAETAPKFLNLPLQILFGADKREQEGRKLVLKRLSNPDVLFWLAGVILYGLWVIYTGLTPAQIDLKAVFDLSLENMNAGVRFNLYAFLMGLSSIGMLATIVFVALTYSQSRKHVHWALTILGLLLLTGFIKLWIAGGLSIVTAFLWPDISLMKGYGFGVPPNDIIGTDGRETAFIKRFIALGSIGAYGMYVLFIPALYMLVKTIFNKSRTNLRPLIGLSSIAAIGFLDIAVLSSESVSSLSLILLVCVVLCWGSVMRYK